MAGTPCTLRRKDVRDRVETVDFSPWTPEETDFVPAGTDALLAGDELDEPDESGALNAVMSALPA
jgi:hypothetical protein